MSNEETQKFHLGDVLYLEDPRNPGIDRQIFLVDYVDNQTITLVSGNVKKIFDLDENTGAIKGVAKVKIRQAGNGQGYARQHGLNVGRRMNIVFREQDGAQCISTGTIVAQDDEEDSIDVALEDRRNTRIHIYFDFQGIPKDSHIEKFELIGDRMNVDDKRAKCFPEEEEKTEEDESGHELDGLDLSEGEGEVEGEEELEEEGFTLEEALVRSRREDSASDSSIVSAPATTSILRRLIEREEREEGSDEEEEEEEEEISVTGETLEVTRTEDVSRQSRRFGLETQVEDLQHALLNALKNEERTPQRIRDIHAVVTSFVRLREVASQFVNNAVDPILPDVRFKPLVPYLSSMENRLHWILWVGANVKKLYDFREDGPSFFLPERADVLELNTTTNVQEMATLFRQYRDSDQGPNVNKYDLLFSQLRPFMSPFVENEYDNDDVTIYKAPVQSSMLVIQSNQSLNSFASDVINFANQSIQTKKFLMENYTTGVGRLFGYNRQTCAKQIGQRKNYPNTADFVSIQSVITLPRPAIAFSRINLPSTDLNLRISLHANYLDYWRIFRQKKVAMKEVTVGEAQLAADIDFAYTKEAFEDDIRHFQLEPDAMTNRKSRLEQFLNLVFPRTNAIVEFFSGEQQNKFILSVEGFVQLLEPFLIYANNLTFDDLKWMVFAVNENISTLRKAHDRARRGYANFLRGVKGVVKSTPSTTSFQLFRLVPDDASGNTVKMLQDKYSDQRYCNTDSELLRVITLADDGRLYNTAVAFGNLLKGLMYPQELASILQQKDKDSTEVVSATECKQIAKRYASLEDLETDNGRAVVFDKEYDTTPYSILLDPVVQQQQQTLNASAFQQFLTVYLLEEFHYSEENALTTAEALSKGLKPVQQGHYAILLKEGEDGSVSYVYYRRDDKDTWIKTEETAANPELFCLLQQKCMPSENHCVSTAAAKHTLAAKVLKEILKEFDARYKISKDELRQRLSVRLETYKEEFDRTKIWRRKETQHQNDKQFQIGSKVSEGNDESKVVSPYQPLCSEIVSDKDFVRRQSNIILFAKKFTRPATEEEAADENGGAFWRYCNETDARLLPSFYLDLAIAYQTSWKHYIDALERVIRQQGVCNTEESNLWYDKYSGCPIIEIDFDLNDDIDDETGAAIQYRSVLTTGARDERQGEGQGEGQQGEGEGVHTYDDANSRIIENIVQVLCAEMHISLPKEQVNYVVHAVNDRLYTLRQAAEREANPRAFLKALFYLTLASFLVAVQTTIPSIQAKKTFPGCSKSFSGYPLVRGDQSGLEYLACVVSEISKPGRSDPKSAFRTAHKTKAEIANAIRVMLAEFILLRDFTRNKIQDKLKYLQQVGAEENDVYSIPSNHRVSSYLPVQGFSPKEKLRVNNVDLPFQDGLLGYLMRGNPAQESFLDVLRTKRDGASIAVQLNIQRALTAALQEKGGLLLRKEGRPVANNAFTVPGKNVIPFLFFIEKTADDNFGVRAHARIVVQANHLLHMIGDLTVPPMYSSAIDTKPVFPTIDTSQFDQSTIQLGFQLFCNFRRPAPVPEHLLPVCGSKADKDNTFSAPAFQRLLQLVSQKNLVKTRLLFGTDPSACLPPPNLWDYLVDKVGTGNTPFKPLLDAILNVEVENYMDAEFNRLSSALRRFVALANERLDYEELWRFSNDASQKDNVLLYLQNLIYLVGVVFPEVVVTSKTNQKVNVPKYWEWSRKQRSSLTEFVTNHFETLKKLAKRRDGKVLDRLKQVRRYTIDTVMPMASNYPLVEFLKVLASITFSLFMGVEGKGKDEKMASMLAGFLQIALSWKRETLDMMDYRKVREYVMQARAKRRNTIRSKLLSMTAEGRLLQRQLRTKSTRLPWDDYEQPTPTVEQDDNDEEVEQQSIQAGEEEEDDFDRSTEVRDGYTGLNLFDDEAYEEGDEEEDQYGEGEEDEDEDFMVEDEDEGVERKKSRRF